MQATSSIIRKNCYAIIDESKDVKFIGSFLIKDDIFKFKPGCEIKNPKLTDFFFTETMKIASNILIDKYLQIAQDN